MPSPTREVRLVSTLALADPVARLLPRFSAETGIAVAADYAPTQRLMERLAEGEAPALAILTDEAARALGSRGEVKARRDLAVSLIGVAAPEGAPKPEFASLEAFLGAIEAAPSVCYSTAGVSGRLFMEAMERVGRADLVRSKAVVIEGGFVGTVILRGEAALGVQMLSELIHAGVRNYAPLPDPVQTPTLFAALVLNRGMDEAAATELADFLASPPAMAEYAAQGLLPP